VKKPFCDNCGADCSDERIATLLVVASYGEPYKPFGSAQPKMGKIMAKVIFSFEDRPDGYGGPPDLCDACKLSLLKRMIQRYESELKK